MKGIIMNNKSLLIRNCSEPKLCGSSLDSFTHMKYFSRTIGRTFKANIHVLAVCNSSCKQCFVTSFPGTTRIMSLKDCKSVILNLFMSGVKYFNIAGGEPCLFHELHEILKFIHSLGCNASIITNGSKLNAEFIKKNGPYIHTLGISVDSFDNETNLKSGRFTGSPSSPKIFGFKALKEIREILKDNNILLKINTVVGKLNFKEKMSEKISLLEIDRWKILKMYAFKDCNHSNYELLPTEEEFNYFVENNPYSKTVVEHSMKNSYIMIDPDGNLLDNANSASGGFNPYHIVGNLITENANEVLARYLKVFNIDLYQKRYL